MSREISDIFSRVSDYILRAKYYLSRYHYWRYAKYIEVNFRFNQGLHPISAKLFLIFFTRSLISNIEQGIMNVEG